MEENKSTELIIVSNNLAESTVTSFCEDMLTRVENMNNKYIIGGLLDEVAELKKDKALLNKVIKNINDYRVAKQKEYLIPYEEQVKKPLDELLDKMKKVSENFRVRIETLQAKEEEKEETNIAEIPTNEELKCKYQITFPNTDVKDKVMKYLSKYECEVKEIKK